MADSLSTSTALDQLKPFVPFALAFLADRGTDSTYSKIKLDLKSWVDRDPLDALVATVLGGGYAYYLAEHESNASCKSPLDGILYASSALFGYDTAPPTTEEGRAVASLVKTFGPALASRAFDPSIDERRAAEAVAQARADAAADVDRQILARLEDIVKLLEKQS
jgi:hypothetical protein